MLFSRLAWVYRTLHVVVSFDENTRFFLGHGMFSSGPRGNSRVLGIVAVWSTAVDIC